MFWEDRPSTGTRNTVRVQPPIPDTGWAPPSYFPDLSQASAIAIDTETYDPELRNEGPGWGRGKGHIVGFSVAVPSGHSWYFPLRHEVEREWNMPDTAAALAWLRQLLALPMPKIGANLVYDLGWLLTEDIHVNGPLYDIQSAEALLNSEAPDVSLDSLAEKYLGIGKETSILYQWCADFYGGGPTDRQRANIYRAPPRLVGPYGEADARLPIQIMTRQWAQMEKRGVLDLFKLECRLFPLLLKMRWKGAPVDVAAAEELHDRLAGEIKELQIDLKRRLGFEVNPSASESMVKAFTQEGLPFGQTARGNPTFPAAALEKLDHWLPQTILEIRRREKIRGTFIESYILKNQINGRVHCQFHPLKGDENGARSGRFASSDPNLQNIPVRTELGRLIRNLFVAQGLWRKYDYSQIEYRLLAHHAVGQGADEVRARYNASPDTDYHEATIDLLHSMVGIELERRAAKTINFGLIYGMSQAELIRRLGLKETDGSSLFDAYHTAVPFARATARSASDEAEKNGYIRTILGRYSDFPMWTTAKYDREAPALPFDQALMKYGKIKRAFTHKALNRRLQGGAADIMKKAMVDCYEAGIFDDTGIPLLTVHDELDFDDLGDPNRPAWVEMVHIMQNCVPSLRVPILVDGKTGARWGEAD
jgi:DNA polymerase-1